MRAYINGFPVEVSREQWARLISYGFVGMEPRALARRVGIPELALRPSARRRSDATALRPQCDRAARTAPSRERDPFLRKLLARR